MRTCTICAGEFDGRADAKYCSPACRQRAHRQRKRPFTFRPEPYVTTAKLNATVPRGLKDRERTEWIIKHPEYPARGSLDRVLRWRYTFNAHLAADCLRFDFCGNAPIVADEIDQLMEWLSVVRDGLRGMKFDERVEASRARCKAENSPAYTKRG